MGWTKLQLVDQAFGELSLSDAQGFEVTADEKQRALRMLDAMLATWAAKGVCIGYAFPGDINSASGIIDSAAETVYLNLAARLAPGYGKQLSPMTLKNAREGYDTLLWAAAHPINQQLPNTQPLGAGNKPWRRTARPFMPKPDPSPFQNNDLNGDLSILPE